MRNPIYAAVILFACAGATAHPGIVSAALALTVAGGMLLRILAEERELRERYRGAYAEYCGRVKRLIPGVF